MNDSPLPEWLKIQNDFQARQTKYTSEHPPDTEPVTLTFTRAEAILMLGCAMTQGAALPPGDLQRRCVEQWLALQGEARFTREHIFREPISITMA